MNEADTLNAMERELVPAWLKEHGYYFHHRATDRRPRNIERAGLFEEYSGRFGEGFKFYVWNTEDNKYCYVVYFVKNNRG